MFHSQIHLPEKKNIPKVIFKYLSHGLSSQLGINKKQENSSQHDIARIETSDHQSPSWNRFLKCSSILQTIHTWPERKNKCCGHNANVTCHVSSYLLFAGFQRKSTHQKIAKIGQWIYRTVRSSTHHARKSHHQGSRNEKIQCFTISPLLQHSYGSHDPWISIYD